MAHGLTPEEAVDIIRFFNKCYILSMKRTFLFLIFILIIVSGSANSQDSELSFGVHPYANPAIIHKNFTPLINYLSEKTGRPIRIVVAPNYITHVMNLGSGKVDMGFVGPSPYVKIKDKFGGIDLLVKMKMDGDINDKMVIITHRNSAIGSVPDLKGKTFAFGDNQSFGSHFMPRYVLNKQGIRLRDLSAYDYVGSHDNVVLSVLHGDFDAGGVRQDIFLKYKERPLKIIEGPVSISPHVIICRSSLGDDLKKTLQTALMNLHDNEILKSLNIATEGFYPVTDRDFDDARKVVDFLESR